MTPNACTCKATERTYGGGHKKECPAPRATTTYGPSPTYEELQAENARLEAEAELTTRVRLSYREETTREINRLAAQLMEAERGIGVQQAKLAASEAELAEACDKYGLPHSARVLERHMRANAELSHEAMKQALAASEETVQELHEAIAGREKAIEEGNDPVVEQYDLMFALIATEPPNGARALARVADLERTIESQASMLDALREGSRSHAQGEREALAELAKLRAALEEIESRATIDCECWKVALAALSERSTSPAPRCHAGSDGDCAWPECPQEANGRANYQSYCPLAASPAEEQS